MVDDPHSADDELHLLTKPKHERLHDYSRVVMLQPRTWYTILPAIPLITQPNGQTQMSCHFQIHHRFICSSINYRQTKAVLDCDWHHRLCAICGKLLPYIYHVLRPRWYRHSRWTAGSLGVTCSRDQPCQLLQQLLCRLDVGHGGLRHADHAL